MNITTKKTTTTVYESTISGDELRALALVAMKNSIDPDATANITVSEADQNADGSITVKVAVQADDIASKDVVADEPKATMADAPAVATPQANAAIPMGIGAPTA